MSTFLNIKPNFSNFTDIIDLYDEALSEAADELNPANKELGEANKAMPVSYAKFASKLQELKAVERFVETTVKKIKGDIWRELKEDSELDLNTRDLEYYSESTKKYVTHKKFLNIIQELVGQYEVVVKAFEHLGFKLKDITAARIAEVHRYIL